MSSWSHHHRRSPHRIADRLAPPCVAAALLKTTDASLAGVIFVAPLFLGGRHDLGRFVFAAFIVVAAVARFSRQAVLGEGTWARRRVHWLLLAATTILLAQLAPLPAAWIDWLAPRTAALLPLWSGTTDPGELGRWNTLSLSPEATRLSLAMLAAYSLLFITVSHRIESREDVGRLLRWVGLAAAAVAIIGLLQAAAPNGRFLWIYEHPSETTFDRLSGPFANRNHFAHFLALGAAPLAAWLFAGAPSHKGGSSTPNRPLQPKPAANAMIAGGLLALTALTVLLTASRGGAIAMTAAAAVFSGLLYRFGLLRRRDFGLVVAGGAVILLAASFVGDSSVAQRFSTLTSTSMDEIDEHGARRKIWTANVAAIKAGVWFGAGAGAHRDVYPVYLEDPPTKEYTHADNGYLQVVTENGIAGGLLLAGSLACCGGWCIRALRRADSPQSIAWASAGAASLAASAVHSAVDFVWYIPGCLATTIMIAACVMRLGELSPAAPAVRRTMPLRLVGSVNLAAAIAIVAAFSVLELFGPAVAAVPWDAYHRTSNAQRDHALQLLAITAEAADAARDEQRAATEAALESMIRELRQVVLWRPACAAAHRQLANRYLELYHLRAQRSDNPMPAPQVREAAIASKFRSAAELIQWLELAFGDNSRLLVPALNHARIAARLAPLQGAPYVRLAALGFLQGQGHAATDAYLRQALLVRPHDGDLLFEVGADLCVRQQVDAGLDCWARALRIRGQHRIKVARAVAGSMPFANLVELFQPQWDTLPEFWKVYRTADEANIAAFLNYAAAQTLRETSAAKPKKSAFLWRRLAQIQLEAGLPSACLASLLSSSKAAPDDYSTRRMLGMVLVDVNRPEEAAGHLQWCLDRQPDDARVADVLTQITRDRLAAQSQSLPTPR